VLWLLCSVFCLVSLIQCCLSSIKLAADAPKGTPKPSARKSKSKSKSGVFLFLAQLA
jgi:hypothetical protein